MSGHFAPRWLCPPPFWHRLRALQAPASPGLFALACSSGAGLSVRCRMAGVKASYGRKNEGTANSSERRGWGS